MCLIRDNTSTPLLSVFDYIQTHDANKYQLMLCVALKCLVHYLLMNKFPNFRPNLNQAEAPW